ncbi:MAG: glycosyltransferase, partial [Gemmatimonadota bacterium]|nr:glycosyltransferase [Gemmatimonadota bacterium]
DGSTDSTVEAVQAFAEEDERIRLLEGGGTRLGALGGFAWLLEHAAPGAEYVMFCDQDDVWLPNKIADTLSAMQKAEADAAPGTPVLVHTDLTVVDEQLGVIDESLWSYQGIQPELDTLDRLLIQNCVTGCTAMINGPLREKAGTVPPEAVMHDWWLTLVASCFGRIVRLSNPTILYRQHGRNDTGAKRHQHGTIDKTITAYSALGERGRAIRRIAAQGEDFLRRYRAQLTPRSRTLIEGAVEHLAFRTSLPERRRYRRVGPISREVISGRYNRFSKGLSSALRDVIL